MPGTLLRRNDVGPPGDCCVVDTADMQQAFEAYGWPKVGLLWVGVWIVCGLVATAGITALDYSNQKQFSALKERGVVAHATVTRTDPGNHNTVYYSFVANGTVYNSGGPSDPPNPVASQLSPGQPLHVVYDSSDPNVSCACDPYDEALSNVWWRRILAGMFLASVISVVITANIVRRRTRG